jgi:SWI/SNF-related matrix-associated actin-dependent regulator 1 of chromatin subfamily A
VFVPTPFIASLDSGEAVLRFPYDERLRVLLRAIPGRRWDPGEKAWRVPLDPERAEALARLLAGLPSRPHVSDALARAIARRRARRRGGECVLDLARPDENWWLSFPTDVAQELVGALMEHPDAYSLPAIGRAQIPLDERSERLIGGLLRDESPRPCLRLTEDASHALTEIAQRGRDVERSPVGAGPSEDRRAEDRRAEDRRAEDRRVENRPAAATPQPVVRNWHGTIEVANEPREPVFLLLGEVDRLPQGLRERAVGAPGGATVPLTLESWRLMDGALHGWITRAARRCVAALTEGRPAPGAILELSGVHEDRTFVLAPGHDTEQLAAFAALAGASSPPPRSRHGLAHEHARLPAIRADPFCVPELDRFIAAHETWVQPLALTVLQEIREQHAHAEGLVALSAATDAPCEVTGLGGELKPFQRAGVSYLLAQRRAFLADEQGLGKTIEALAALQADGAFPAVVVCPASLKLNWLAEIERWLPQRSARALVGTGAGPGGAGSGVAVPGVGADITVVNYDIVAARLQELAELTPRALVLDESHYCKNAAAKRTQAVQRLSAAVPADGLVLALTGTPVMNRPPELISQLRIIGRLGDFGSGAQFGRRFRGPDAHMRLHWHLRARCYVRRLKADVLPQLPPKTRGVVPVELDNEHEYRLAERDVVAWLRSQPLDLRQLDARVAAALRAERLVRLNALKLLAARGKLHAALAWIHDFCSSGERLVVFAKHREIQRAVIERFPRALHILGEDGHTARDESLREFQAPDDGAENQLIVCSIEVAGQGLTLTRSSNVVFLELDWTPAKHDQAEDRCHRIGQQDAVNATYLLAAGTIDETIATLLERKRAVIAAVTDGHERDEEGVVDGLVRELAGEPYRALRAVA